jgi:hypothetical protein
MPAFDPMSPEAVGSPMEQAYMSDGDYEAISSEDEFIDIDTDVVRYYMIIIVCPTFILVML